MENDLESSTPRPAGAKQTYVDLPFADGVYTFKYRMPQILELERKCDVGIGGLYARLLRGRFGQAHASIGAPDHAEYRIGDVVEVIRQGLIGGGRGVVDGVEINVSSATAFGLINSYVMTKDGDTMECLSSAWDTAVAALSALIIGHEPPVADG